MKTIVVGFDGSQHSKKALEQAEAIAEKFGSKICIVHVIDTAVLSLSEAFSTPQIKRLSGREARKYCGRRRR